MLNFDWTITLGQVVGSIVLIAGTWAAVQRLYGLLDKRLSVFETTLKGHAQTLVTHSDKMAKQDEMMLNISRDLHRLIGRMEAWSDVRQHRDTQQP